jgi:hypothetical protein
MSFTMLLLAPDADPSWPEKIRQAVPGAVAKIHADPRDALPDIETADAAYGTVPAELFARAKKLRWICASRAGLGSAYFYDALVCERFRPPHRHRSDGSPETQPRAGTAGRESCQDQ